MNIPSGWCECNVCKLDIMFVCNFIVNVDNTNVPSIVAVHYSENRIVRRARAHLYTNTKPTHTLIHLHAYACVTTLHSLYNIYEIPLHWILYRFQFETSRQINIPLNSFKWSNSSSSYNTDWVRTKLFWLPWRSVKIRWRKQQTFGSSFTQLVSMALCLCLCLCVYVVSLSLCLSIFLHHSLSLLSLHCVSSSQKFYLFFHSFFLVFFFVSLSFSGLHNELLCQENLVHSVVYISLHWSGILFSTVSLFNLKWFCNTNIILLDCSVFFGAWLLKQQLNLWEKLFHFDASIL